MELSDLADAERYLDGFINRERQVGFDYEKLGLERIRALLAALADPHEGLACVHIAGSKGKGSTALACEALLRAAGLRVASFTQPHLETWLERFRIDGESAPEGALLQALREMQPALERLRADPRLRPSFFDVTTAAALLMFRSAGVDAAVMEVGIGGRIDSTNVVDSSVSVLTAVQLEHMDKLGDTLEAIATEKAGIMRPGVPFLHGPLGPEAFGVVLARSVALDAPLEEVAVHDVRPSRNGIAFRLDDGRAVASAVLGEHQAANLALAVRAAEHFLGAPLPARALAALEDLILPARVERIGDAILDCSHTPDSARALRTTLEARWPGRPWVLALSISRDKAAAEILAELAAPTRACVIAQAEPERSWLPEELEPLAWASGIGEIELVRDPVAAIARARELCGGDDLLVATGSVYFAGAVRRALLDCAPGAIGREPAR